MIQYPAIINPTQTEVRTISSKFVQQDYRLFISLPETYTTSDKNFPVLYLLDGNGIFPIVKPIIELQQLMVRVPELIIVGIGYPTETYMDTVTLRGRDLTHVELTAEQKASDGYPFDETGGASHFFSFVTQELIPYIDHEFRADLNDRTLAGFSLGGTFVLYALFQEPALFNRMIAISPGLDGILDIEAQYAKTHASLPIKLFLASETPLDDTHTPSRIERLRQFIRLIDGRGYTGLTSKLKIFEGLDHASAGPIGLTYALREIFE